jgi:hypothetical protein
MLCAILVHHPDIGTAVDLTLWIVLVVSFVPFFPAIISSPRSGAKALALDLHLLSTIRGLEGREFGHGDKEHM